VMRASAARTCSGVGAVTGASSSTWRVIAGLLSAMVLPPTRSTRPRFCQLGGNLLIPTLWRQSQPLRSARIGDAPKVNLRCRTPKLSSRRPAETSCREETYGRRSAAATCSAVLIVNITFFAHMFNQRPWDWGERDVADRRQVFRRQEALPGSA